MNLRGEAMQIRFFSREGWLENKYHFHDQMDIVLTMSDGGYFYVNNRPLAKLSKAFKVADTGNQGKAESKALSAVTVTLREDTESFKKTDGVFNKDTFS